MVGIVLASHGMLCEGMRESAQMIFGPQDDVATAALTPSMGPDDFRRKVLEAVSSLSQQEQVLFLVDLWGGTPHNQIGALIEGHGDGWVAVTGLNLPMVISALSERMDASTAVEVAQAAYPEAREGIRIRPERLSPTTGMAAQVPPAAQVGPGAAPKGDIGEGTVLGDGHIDIAFTRIDTRLLHGQVATTVTKTVRPDRIIVCSDDVAADGLRKSMIEQAAPPGVKAHVVPIDKIIAVSRDPRFGNTRAMLLFENPQDLLRAVEGGVDIRKVNLGSMAHAAGKVVVTNAIAMDMDDVNTLEKLASMGVEFDIRKVPTESAQSFEAAIAKARAELASQ